jgi:hypothetical protein
MVSDCRPMPGCAASRFVGETPGWDRLLVMPHPRARLRASSSRANRATATFDWLYALLTS